MKNKKIIIFGAIATGIISGAIITAAREIIHFGHHAMRALLKDPVVFGLAYAALACTIYFLLKKEPLISGGEIPDVHKESDPLRGKWRSVIPLKFLGAILTLSSGLTMGIEGPSVQIGGFTGQMLARDDVHLRHDLVGSGIAGALGAAFQAPLTGILFALEAVHHSIEKRSLMTAMLGAISGTLVASAYFGDSPVVAFLNLPELGAGHIVFILLLAIFLGLSAALFQTMVFYAHHVTDKLPCFIRTLLPFFITAIALFVMPALFGSGEHLLFELLSLNYSVWLLFALKLFLLVLCAASGLPGGIFFPVLVIGALGGTALGQVFVNQGLMASPDLLPFALIAMAGFFSAVVRTPLTAVTLVLEMTGAFTMLLPLVTVSVIAALTARIFLTLFHIPQPTHSKKEELS